MISKEAVQKYLERELQDLSFIKKCNKEEILQQFSNFENLPEFKVTPFLHQLISIYLGLCFDNFLYFLDMGLGKTFCSLYLIQAQKRFGNLKKCLVVVPNSINIESWKEEVLKYTDLTVLGLEGTKTKRLKFLSEEHDIFIINYAGLQSYMTTTVEVKKGKYKRTIDRQAANRFSSLFNMVIFDEIHKCAEIKTLTYSLCSLISDKCQFRYGLTGTPIGKNAEHLWPIFNLIDKGETLGDTVSLYMQAFFKKVPNYFGTEYCLDESKKELLYKFLLNKSIRYVDTECNDLPDLIEIKVKFSLKADASNAYNSLYERALKASENELEVKENYYSKFRQICSGFLYLKTENPTEKSTVVFAESEKLEYLLEMIDDMPSDSKMIVFHNFIKTGELIAKSLQKNKIKFLQMKESKQYSEFKKDETIKVLIVNVISGGTGLNLQVANYMVFYEPVDRYREYVQAKKRTHRTGQTKTVYCYDFITQRSVEEKMHQYLKQGKDLSDVLIEGKIDRNLIYNT